jgi:hypothetical protein
LGAGSSIADRGADLFDSRIRVLRSAKGADARIRGDHNVT